MPEPRPATLPPPSIQLSLVETRAKLRSIYALGKPNLSLLVVVTAVLGYVLAASTKGVEQTSWLKAIMLVVGTGLTAMGACAANMCREAAIDARMNRTRNRPIPSGRVEDTEAFAYALVTSMIGFALLYAFCGPLPALLSVFTIVVYAFVYTPAKLRGPISVWIGAVPGAVPPLMGWATVTGGLEVGAFCLFGLMFTWQFPHFLSLAYMYREDYARGGFRFLAEEDTEARTGRDVAVGAVFTVAASSAPILLGLTGPVYGVIAGLAAVYFLRPCLAARKGLDATSARRAFLASILYLPVLLVGIVLDRAFALLG